MKSYAVEAGVPSEAVFMDHAGFSTYESMYRARDIFQVRRIVIVTQNYHMYRALYIAQAMGMDAYGVPSSPNSTEDSWDGICGSFWPGQRICCIQ